MPTRRKVNSVRVVLLVVVCILIIAGLAGVLWLKKTCQVRAMGIRI